MAKYDEQLNRMLSLMEDKKPVHTTNGSIWCSRVGADGNVYGIVKEGTKFYIKTTEQGKETLAESYDYLGGFNNRMEHAYSSFNKASQHLEQELIHLNESCGKHEDVSLANLNRSEEAYKALTAEARVELDRVKMIMENCEKIGMNNTGDPESKGKATAENTTKNNAPFEKKVDGKMDFAGEKGTVKGATDNTDVNGVDADLQSDKMKTKNSGSEKDYKDAHDDLEGEGVADKKPAGGKVVRVNESIFSNPDVPADDQLEDLPDEISVDDFGGSDDSLEGMMANDVESSDEGEELPQPPTEEMNGADQLIGTSGDEPEDIFEEIDNLLEAFGVDTKDVITGPDKVLDGPHGGDSKDAEWEHVGKSADVNGVVKEGDEVCPKCGKKDCVCKDGECTCDESLETGSEETMKNYKSKGSLPVQTWDKMNESVQAIANAVCDKLFENAKKKETLEEAINRIVKEEVTKLDAWGKHPRYRKAPMTLPANKEVLAGTADRDFNDDSAKGEQPYGQKIGSSAPYDKIVDMLTDQVMAQLKK